MSSDQEIQKIVESLSPIERKILPHIDKSINSISEKSDLDKTTVLRALQFLSNKGLISLQKETKDIVDLSTNGIYYKKNHLPERKLLILLEEKNHLQLQEAKKLSKLTDNEFKVSLGVLKGKALINLNNGKISLIADKSDLTKKFPEELLLDVLPKPLNSLIDMERFALINLQKRKEIIEINQKSEFSILITDLGKKVMSSNLNVNLIESVTPELIKSWKSQKNKKFRSYDLSFPVPKIHGGRKHFVNQSIESGKRIWLDLGFKEMTGSLVQSSFWNFDALFTAQDHPVREMQDTFFIKKASAKLPEKSLVQDVKKAHESGISGSKGWQYTWNEESAKSVVLRTHTTCLSAHTLSKLDIKKDLPAKFFSIGKCFRNETVDWSHGFEFNQTEGIVIDENANLRHLIGYLKEFAKKMGFENIRIQPAYFPYTEPSLEGAIWNEEKKEWVEVLAAGILRPEVVVPLLGKNIPVLAWGPGFDRLMMMANDIKDLRELYKNDLYKLRNQPIKIK